ncbi:acyl-CoA-binding protein (ACBP)/diazepam binding inhibitor (DBI)/endozepine (EP) [Sporothrix bragantina]|uniref:Acyl-CoA-binding protein (ACBP)/diazepam binding inhibitor (DBI)/endozepine (EP) n=1 Tax=Sporothrix bragantina TaxID=671064 RepID=A0ABP0B767_9PEZI
MTSNAAFEQAQLDVRKLKQKPSPDELLKLYALYKIGTGADITKARAPGMFELQAKAMRRAWQDMIDKEEYTPEDAQKAYIEFVEKLKVEHGYDPTKEPEAVRT